MSKQAGTIEDLINTGIASRPTVAKWLQAKSDQPWVLRVGKPGRPWSIDVAGAVAAWHEDQAAEAEERRVRAQRLAEGRKALGLANSGDPETAGLTSSERLALLQEEREAIKIGQMRRKLVDREDVQAAIASVLIKDAQRRATFAARLAKKIDLSREQIAAVEALVSADQDGFADDLEGLSDDNGVLSPSTEMVDPAVYDGRRARRKSGPSDATEAPAIG